MPSVVTTVRIKPPGVAVGMKDDCLRVRMMLPVILRFLMGGRAAGSWGRGLASMAVVVGGDWAVVVEGGDGNARRYGVFDPEDEPEFILWTCRWSLRSGGYEL